MAVVGPLLKVLPFGKKKGGHEEGGVHAAAAGHQPTKHNVDPSA